LAHIVREKEFSLLIEPMYDLSMIGVYVSGEITRHLVFGLSPGTLAYFSTSQTVNDGGSGTN
jgi:hypothetical protein